MTQTNTPPTESEPKPAGDQSSPQKPAPGGSDTPHKPDAIPDEDLDQVEEQPS